MKRFYLYWFSAAALLATSCGTTHATGNKDANVLNDQEIKAISYRDNGEIEASIEVYRQLIAANPKSFKSVLYQDAIMRNSEGLNDPWRHIDEMKRTVQLFTTACNENYDGATQDEIQHERDALQNYIFNKGMSFHQTLIKSTPLNLEYARIAANIFNIYTSDLYNKTHFDINREKYCTALNYQSGLMYLAGNTESSINGYTSFLNDCKPANISNESQEAAMNYMAAAHTLVFSCYWSISNCEVCPFTDNSIFTNITDSSESNNLDNVDELFNRSTFPVLPINDNQMKFIEASKFYWDVVQNYNPNNKLYINYLKFGEISSDELKGIAFSAMEAAGTIYFAHNYFEQAIHLFQTIIQTYPHLINRNIAQTLIKYYIYTKKYDVLKDTIQKFQNDPDYDHIYSMGSEDNKKFKNFMDNVMKKASEMAPTSVSQ